MKILTKCVVYFSQDIDVAALADAVSGPMYGDYASFTDVECSLEAGHVGNLELTGYYNHPNRTNGDEEELALDIAELLGDILSQYGFPVDVVEPEIKDYCGV